MSIEYLQKRAARVTDLLEATKKIGVTPLANSDWRYAGKLALKYRKQNPNFIGPFKNKYEKFNDVLKIDKNKYNNFIYQVKNNPNIEHLLQRDKGFIEKGSLTSTISPSLMDRMSSKAESIAKYMDSIGINPNSLPSIKANKMSLLFDNIEEYIKTKKYDYKRSLNKFIKKPDQIFSNFQRYAYSTNNPVVLGNATGTIHAHPKSTPVIDQALNNIFSNKYSDFIRDANKLPLEDRRRSIVNKVFTPTNINKLNMYNFPSSEDIQVFAMNPNHFHSVRDNNTGNILSVKPTIDPKKIRSLISMEN